VSKQDDSNLIFGCGTIIFALAVTVGVILLCMFALPQYHVWSSKKAGEAILAKAESERLVRVAEAQGKVNASTLEAQAEINRAEGAAKANQILGQSLNPLVLQYLWIRALEENGNSQGEKQVIYIPTDTKTGLPMGLPITESERFSGGAGTATKPENKN
jgi:hypothetical protein